MKKLLAVTILLLSLLMVGCDGDINQGSRVWVREQDGKMWEGTVLSVRDNPIRKDYAVQAADGTVGSFNTYEVFLIEEHRCPTPTGSTGRAVGILLGFFSGIMLGWLGGPLAEGLIKGKPTKPAPRPSDWR